LLAGLLVGHLRTHYPFFGRIPDGAVALMTSLGLAAFGGLTGIHAGPGCLSAVQEAGLGLLFGEKLGDQDLTLPFAERETEFKLLHQSQYEIGDFRRVSMPGESGAGIIDIEEPVLPGERVQQRVDAIGNPRGFEHIKPQPGIVPVIKCDPEVVKKPGE